MAPPDNPQPETNADELALQVELLQGEIGELRERNDALADAVINSAQIIDELEQTKVQLAEAQARAESARLDAQRMSETIFEGTHDAVMVLDQDMGVLSANLNASTLFEIPSVAKPGWNLFDRLGEAFNSEMYRDWIQVSIEKLKVGETVRYELFRNRTAVDLRRQWVELSMSRLKHSFGNARYLLTAHDITQRKQIEDQFQHQALHDNVTGLPNRRYFVQKIEEQLDSATPESWFAVCFLDLDNFKSVNDTLGHEAGDVLLVQVAKRIQNTIRQECILARFGGDEFAILTNGLNEFEVRAVGERIIKKLSEPFSINGNTVYVGASIGMTQYPEDGTDANSLMQNADVAMYSAKEGGRNRFHIFTSELAARIQENQQILDELRVSLKQKDIGVEYQPKWCMKTDRLAGCEALLRWRRNGKQISTQQLVDIAECSGLILPLGDLVVQIAIQQMKHWNDKFSFDGTMAINLSPRQLVDPDFIERFQKILGESGISPASIELEITENAMVENLDVAFDRIDELIKLGVSIAIDDFGTGYSSLSYLKSFPVSTLKIDRSFVCDLPNDPKAVAVAQTILSLGHGLGLTVVAEGVEEEPQRAFLQEAGCDLYQGYLLRPAIKSEVFEETFFSTP